MSNVNEVDLLELMERFSVNRDALKYHKSQVLVLEREINEVEKQIKDYFNNKEKIEPKVNVITAGVGIGAEVPIAVIAENTWLVSLTPASMINGEVMV